MKHANVKRIVARCMAGGLCLIASAWPVTAAQFTEPDVVLFGRVLNVGSGGSHQLFQGTLSFTMVSSTQPTQVMTRTTDLYPVGAGGEFSYRHSIKMFVQADSHETGSGVPASGVPVSYSIINASLDGHPVTVADPAQLRQLVISSASRGGEYQVDLLVSRPEMDSDGDGMPDWWEDLHGLNKFSAADASADPDSDGLTNLQEFNGGTDPNVANIKPQVMETTVQVPVGGTAGLMLNLVAQGISATDLYLSFTNSISGVTWMEDGVSLPVGGEFTWQAMRDGRISVGISNGFVSGHAQLKIRNVTPGASNTVSGATLRLQGFSPVLGMSAEPSLWYSGESYVRGSDWVDLSGYARAAYQPAVSAQPAAVDSDRAVSFGSSTFLYVDDRQWSPSDFTALLAFNRHAGGGTRQTIFNNSKLEIAIVGDSDAMRRLDIRQSKRAIDSLMLRQSNSVMTVYNSAAAAWVDVADQARYFSITNNTTKPGAYTTLGALRNLTSSTATNFFHGSLSELVFFDHLISIKNRGQLQDYLLARWEDVTAWNYRNAILPMTIHGDGMKRNAIAGGYGDDTLAGGSEADILRGGPGSNVLRGGGQGDRFVFEPNESDDTVLDVKLAEGDVLDLNAIFADVRGHPLLYIAMRPVVARGLDGPEVDTVIDISYSGNVGSAVDQTITLKNVSLEETELLNYMAMGSIQLGGLSFSEPAVAGPATARVLTVGESTWLEVLPTGAQPASYRWQLNGIDVPGGVTNQLYIAPTNRAAEGYYSVIISNQHGSVTSSPAFMKVLVPQEFKNVERGPDGSIRFMFRDPDGMLAPDLSRFDVQWTTNFTGESTIWFNTGSPLSYTNDYISYEETDPGDRARAIYRVFER